MCREPEQLPDRDGVPEQLRGGGGHPLHVPPAPLTWTLPGQAGHAHPLTTSRKITLIESNDKYRYLQKL